MRHGNLATESEIGCFHALLHHYESNSYVIAPENLQDGVFRYLTSPSGNPKNFSYVSLVGRPDGEFELRQQVRVESHVASDIRFTPDLVVLVKGAAISGDLSPDFAGGRRRMFLVKSDQVVAAHECKSMNPLPELMVAFVGMLVTAHSWYPDGATVKTARKGHLAPTLFVGGAARALHLKMIEAMQKAYRMNIVVGMHKGTWRLKVAKNKFQWASRPTTP